MNLEEAFSSHASTCTEDMTGCRQFVLNGRTVRSHPFMATIDHQGKQVTEELNHMQKLVDGEWKTVTLRVVGDRIFPDL